MKKVEDGLAGMLSLEEVYLSENFIKKIDGVSTLVIKAYKYWYSIKLKKNLIVLDYSYNKLTKLEGIEQLQQIEEFWVI